MYSVSEEELLKDIRVADKLVDGYLSSTKYDRQGRFSKSKAADQFGSWQEAREAAGIT